jgi:cell division protein FtsN
MKDVNVLKLCICLGLILALASCKSSESAYKKAYETAKSQERAEVSATEATTPQPVSKEASVRRERVTVVSGHNNTLKTYGVVCGSFGLKTNAEALKSYLQSEGYSRVAIAFNTDIVMYRVIVESYDDKGSAINARDTFKARYPHRNDFQGSWILERL